MKRDDAKHSEQSGGLVLSGPVSDAALDWFTALQGYPDDKQLQADFQAWLHKDPRNAAAYTKIAGVWDLGELDDIAADMGRAGADIPSAPIPKLSRPVPFFRMGAIMAAAIFIAVGVAQYPALMMKWRSDFQTVAGMSEDVVLPDGSRMTLNTATAVALDFEGGRRSVHLLQGEAYFDVVHDDARPFKVVAGYAEVVVKGTAFGVRNDGAKDVVTLERGIVDVFRITDKNDSVELRPGEMVTATATVLSSIQSADPSTALAWRYGRLIFENQPFEKIVDELARYYGKSIIVTSNRIGQAQVTGNYMLDNPERVIRSLAATIGASVTRLPGGIIILS